MIRAPHGTWQSPISTDSIVRDTVGLSSLRLHGEDVFWLESRASEGGRNVLVRRFPDGATIDVTLPGFNVRTRVHEYGGGAYAVVDGACYFTNFADQRLYHQAFDAVPVPISPMAEIRHGDLVPDPGGSGVIAVREDHTQGQPEAVNTLVQVTPQASRTLAEGYDFYSSPRLSPDGRRLAWLCWRHPNMPWDGTELWVAEWTSSGSLEQTHQIAGGRKESIYQPEWSPGGNLYFTSDRTGWWNLYQWSGSEVVQVTAVEAEFGRSQFGLGQSNYGFINETRILATPTAGGVTRLVEVDTTTGELAEISTGHTVFADVQVGEQRAVFVAASRTAAAAVVSLDLRTREVEILKRSSELDLPDGSISIGEPTEFPTEGGRTAHAFYYPPTSTYFEGPDGERPPLIVRSHGGPTGAVSNTLNLGIQFWTSRGFAYVDVNYGGSTGYGREYRERLYGHWGVVDVDDCINAARHLLGRGLAATGKVAITGGSAGGYTTLCALAFRDFFNAGASHFGVADLCSFAETTHKFESRYLDQLIGPYPEARDLYIERSPIRAVSQIRCPVILFQGLEDRVVPREQAEEMVSALEASGLTYAYVPFEGEQHGFREARNIKRALEAEMDFYSQVFGIRLAEKVEPVHIHNLLVPEQGGSIGAP